MESGVGRSVRPEASLLSTTVSVVRGQPGAFSATIHPYTTMNSSQLGSAIDAAAKLLGETSEPMNCQTMIDAIAKKGWWSSPGGKTPHATLYQQ